MLKSKEFGNAIAEAIQRKLGAGAVKSKAEIARHFGIQPPSLVDWVKKGSVAKDKLPKLFEYFSDVCGPEHWGLKSYSVFGIDVKTEAVFSGADYVIDQYHEVAGAMGQGVILRDQPGQITGWRVTKEWINKNVPSNTGPGNLRIVTGFGDSMRGMFNSGDPLIVDTGVRTVEFDAVYFFRVGDEGFIKRLQRIPGDGIRVISSNKDYENWTIRDDMDFEVFGRVLKVWKSEEF